MGLFGGLFGGEQATVVQGTVVGTPFLEGSELTKEFLQMAIEEINDVVPVPNVAWIQSSENPVGDEDNPFVVDKPVTTEYAVKILFLMDDLEDRQLFRYLKDSALTTGQINGWMYPYAEFKPSTKDTIRWNGDILNVKAIDPIQPIDNVILYSFEFGA